MDIILYEYSTLLKIDRSSRWCCVEPSRYYWLMVLLAARTWLSALSGNCFWQKTAMSPKVHILFLRRICIQMTVAMVVLKLGPLIPTWDNPVGWRAPCVVDNTFFLCSDLHPSLPHSCYSREHFLIILQHDNFHLWVCFLRKLICSYWSQELPQSAGVQWTGFQGCIPPAAGNEKPITSGRWSTDGLWRWQWWNFHWRWLR